MQCHNAVNFALRSRSFQGQIPHIFHNNYLHLTKLFVFVKQKYLSNKSICQGQIQLKIKCQDHFKVNYLKLFIIASSTMTPLHHFREGHTWVKVKVKHLSRSNLV